MSDDADLDVLGLLEDRMAQSPSPRAWTEIERRVSMPDRPPPRQNRTRPLLWLAVAAALVGLVAGVVAIARDDRAATTQSSDGPTTSVAPTGDDEAVGEDVADDGQGAVVEGPVTVVDLQWVQVPLDGPTFAQSQLVATAASESMVVIGGAVGDDAAVWTSTDRVSWTRVPHDPSVFGGDRPLAVEAIVSWGDGFVAVGENGSSGPIAVWISEDGLTWERVPHDEDSFGETGGGRVLLAASDDRLVIISDDLAVAESGGPNGNAVWTSSDGRTWQRQPPFGDGGVSSVSGSADGFLAVGGGTWASTDGSRWDRLPDGEVPSDRRIRFVTATESGFVMIGADADLSGAWTSTDGTDWTPANVEVPSETIITGGWAIAAASSGLAAVGMHNQGEATSTILVSADGTSWQPAVAPGLLRDAGLRSVTGFGSHFVAVGSSIWTTTDPASLDGATESRSDDETSAVSRGARLIDDVPAGVESGTIDTPEGAIRWIHLSGDSDSLPAGEAIAWPSGFALFEQPVIRQNSQFAIPDIINPARLWVSPDGIDWQVDAPIPIPSDTAWVRLSHTDDGYWLISSDPNRAWRSNHGVTWEELDASGLGLPVPAGFDTLYSLIGPVVAARNVAVFEVSFAAGFPWADYVAGFDANNPCVERFHELEPGVFEMRGSANPCPSEPPVLRFEETVNGLRVLDNTTNAELGDITGVDLSHIARIAGTDEMYGTRVFVIRDGEIAPAEVPWAEAGNDVDLFGADDWIYAYVRPANGRTEVWRTSDARSWTSLGPPRFAAEVTSPVARFSTSSDGTLVALSSGQASSWETTDGVTWTAAPGAHPDGTTQVRLASGWFANDGSRGGPVDGDGWWMLIGDEWVSLDGLGIRGSADVDGGGVGATATNDTTIFYTADPNLFGTRREMWIMTAAQN